MLLAKTNKKQKTKKQKKNKIGCFTRTLLQKAYPLLLVSVVGSKVLKQVRGYDDADRVFFEPNNASHVDQLLCDGERGENTMSR
jgi:hypothetical protein